VLAWNVRGDCGEQLTIFFRVATVSASTSGLGKGISAARRGTVRQPSGQFVKVQTEIEGAQAGGVAGERGPAPTVRRVHDVGQGQGSATPRAAHHLAAARVARLELADAAIVDVTTFTLDGRPMRGVRRMSGCARRAAAAWLVVLHTSVSGAGVIGRREATL
jgi:hypothetical protein